MAKVTIKGLKQTKQNIRIGLLRTVRDQGMLNLVARNLVAEMRGKVGEDGIDPLTDKPYPKKSKEWTKRQLNLIRTGNKPDANWSPRTSNLTFTGQLLKSIKATIQISKSLIIIEPKGVHKAYTSTIGAVQRISFKNGKTVKGRLKKGKKGKNVQNKDLAKWLSESSTPRNILGVSDKTVTSIVNTLSKTLKRYLGSKFGR